MSHNGNWFAVSRLIFDHPVVGIHDRPFTDLEAWLWLLAEAAFEPVELYNKGTIIVLDPGQIMHARTYLAQRWEWTEDKVRWFLKRLQNEAMIARFCQASKAASDHTQHRTQQHTQPNTQPNTQQRNNQIQIISICNYGQYQFSQTNQEAAQHPATPPAPHPAEPPATPPKANNLTTKQKKDKSAPDGAVDDARGTRLRKDWALPSEWRQWAVSEIDIPAEKIDREAEQFRDYWIGLPKARGTKLDWEATWRNWLRRNYADRRAAHQANSSVKRPAPFWWRDDPDKAENLPAEVWRRAVKTFANGKWPIETLGPPPDAAGCLVPDDVVEEFQLVGVYDERGARR